MQGSRLGRSAAAVGCCSCGFATLAPRLADSQAMSCLPLPAHAVTLHPHGVAYLKGSEGSPYEDGTTGEQQPCLGECKRMNELHTAARPSRLCMLFCRRWPLACGPIISMLMTDMQRQTRVTTTFSRAPPMCTSGT